MSLLSLLILKLRLQTDREIDFLFKFNADMRVVVDTRLAKMGRAPQCFRKFRNYHVIFLITIPHTPTLKPNF